MAEYNATGNGTNTGAALNGSTDANFAAATMPASNEAAKTLW